VGKNKNLLKTYNHRCER